MPIHLGCVPGITLTTLGAAAGKVLGSQVGAAIAARLSLPFVERALLLVTGGTWPEAPVAVWADRSGGGRRRDRRGCQSDGGLVDSGGHRTVGAGQLRNRFKPRADSTQQEWQGVVAASAGCGGCDGG